jgi:aspartyl/asparaginyl beta-hydroxylase (cupin superfamily)
VVATQGRVRSAPSPSGAVLQDEQLDRRLRRDGFVTFPLFGRHELDHLRLAFLDGAAGAGSGFHSDLTTPDPTYRREADELIASVVDDRVVDRFTGYEPFLHNFLCKFPGSDSGLYLHQDWMYVDERAGARTYVAWIALDDIDHDNGQLQVLRSSHRFERALRGTGLTAPWLEHREVIGERLSWIPVRAGECVVFDNALVHCSAPNETDRPRVAVAVGLCPEGSQLVHFRRDGPDTATLHHVDRDFFLTRTPQDLATDGIDEAPIDTVPAAPAVELDAAALARLADRSPLARLDQARRAGRVLRARAAASSRRAATASRRAAEGAGRTAHRVRQVAPAVSARGRDLRRRARSLVDAAPTALAMQVLRANEASINRFGPATRAVWDPHDFAWASRIEAGWAEIRAEVDELLAGPTEIPHIEDVTGGIPQGNEGPWRSFVLMHQGRWIDWNCDRCPRTTELVRSIPGLTLAGFSVLEPGTHITEHRGPNKGALRYQLGVVVPGADGDCRIRVGHEMLVWREGEGVAFDFTVPHEAWNDSDGIRVLLMLEVLTPLPWYLAGTNRLAQRAMGWFPTTRDMTRRLRALEPQLAKTSR